MAPRRSSDNRTQAGYNYTPGRPMPAPAPAPAPRPTNAGGGPGIVNTPQGPYIGTLPRPTPAPLGPQTWVPQRQPGASPGPSGPSAEEILAAARAAAEAEARRQADIAEERRVNEALAAAKTFFQTYGMDALWGGVENLVRRGYSDAATISGILSRDANYQSAYFARFPAVQRIRELNKQRQQQGLTIIAEPSPATYVGLEEGYRRALTGLPTGLWGSAQDVADWIVKDVSPEEVAERVTVARNYINYSANASVKNQLRRLYGMTDSEMTAYVLDEERAMGFIQTEYQKRMRQATVGAAADDAGIRINDGMRDQLAGNDAFGESYGNTLAGFQNVAEIADTYSQLGRMSGIETTTEELVTDQFGLTGAADIANKKRKLSSQERARFGGSSAIATTSLNARPIGSQ